MSEGLDFLNVALPSFAGAAVFVGGFIIQNTFRIIVAQRPRSLGLLRAIGATGRRVVSMVVVEALWVGAAASALRSVAGGLVTAFGIGSLLTGLIGEAPGGIAFVGLGSVVVFVGVAAVDALAADYPAVEVQNQREFIAAAEAQADQKLALISGLLGIAIVIAVMGITNTLALSISERTREAGLLRAVGMSRRQVRSMIRWEAVIVALFRAVVGLALGVFFGWSIVTALADEGLGGFTIPRCTWRSTSSSPPSPVCWPQCGRPGPQRA